MKRLSGEKICLFYWLAVLFSTEIVIIGSPPDAEIFRFHYTMTIIVCNQGKQKNIPHQCHITRPLKFPTDAHILPNLIAPANDADSLNKPS